MGCAGKTEIPCERVPYLSALEVCSRRGAIQIHVYLYLYLFIYFKTAVLRRVIDISRSSSPSRPPMAARAVTHGRADSRTRG